jgi:hypothetical protein
LQESIVACVMLMAVISVVMTVRFRLSGVWRDIQHQQIATSELSDQLDRLTSLPINQLRAELDSMQPSKACQQSLNQPTLSGELAPDELGQRLTLKLDWQRRFKSRPTELSAWVLADGPTEEASE